MRMVVVSAPLRQLLNCGMNSLTGSLSRTLPASMSCMTQMAVDNDLLHEARSNTVFTVIGNDFG